MPIPVESLQLPQAYWNDAAEKYDQAFAGTLVGKMWRDAVWQELDAGFEPGSRVLELNCGTGIDAIHLAHRGVSVLGCDISSRMIELARQNAAGQDLRPCPDFRVLPTEQLSTLGSELIFDGAFSNFSGLNCVQDLAEVRRNLARLLKPGARVFICMLGTFAVWEKLRAIAKRDWKNVVRTFQASDSASAQSGVKVRYLSSRKIADSFAPEFKLRKWKGIGITVPPSNLEHWAGRFPAITRSLSRVDRLIGGLPLVRNFGGCILLEFERTARLEESNGRPAASP
jgi:ubiquinone/menaquinone biosynthesis C-methylase UbiE